MVIYNYQDWAVEDTINYSNDWEYSKIEYKNIIIPDGIFRDTICFAASCPGRLETYYVFYSTRDRSNIIYNNHQIRYATFSIGKNDQDGSLINKDVPVITNDSLSGSMTAVRHGNGRDWWLIAPRRYGEDVYVYLIDPRGVHFHERYNTGLPPLLPNGGIGQVYTSPDGSWVQLVMRRKIRYRWRTIIFKSF